MACGLYREGAIDRLVTLYKKAVYKTRVRRYHVIFYHLQNNVISLVRTERIIIANKYKSIVWELNMVSLTLTRKRV